MNDSESERRTLSSFGVCPVPPTDKTLVPTRKGKIFQGPRSVFTEKSRRVSFELLRGKSITITGGMKQHLCNTWKCQLCSQAWPTWAGTVGWGTERGQTVAGALVEEWLFQIQCYSLDQKSGKQHLTVLGAENPTKKGRDGIEKFK